VDSLTAVRAVVQRAVIHVHADKAVGQP
jgi:hypothetical protein